MTKTKKDNDRHHDSAEELPIKDNVGEPDDGNRIAVSNQKQFCPIFKADDEPLMALVIQPTFETPSWVVSLNIFDANWVLIGQAPPPYNWFGQNAKFECVGNHE